MDTEIEVYVAKVVVEKVKVPRGQLVELTEAAEELGMDMQTLSRRTDLPMVPVYFRDDPRKTGKRLQKYVTLKAVNAVKEAGKVYGVVWKKMVGQSL